MSQKISEDFYGQTPETIEDLLILPGVGRKTANLVLTLGHKKPGICVDTHVHRICNRWGYVNTKTPEKTEEELREKLPRKFWIPLNRLLVAFGQNQCVPISPWCSSCVLDQFCKKVGVISSR
jgi:endonuclease-3